MSGGDRSGDVNALPGLPRRGEDSHKGTMGTVAIIGGSVSAAAVMLGAPVLAAWSAVRSGAGLVRLVVPEPLLLTALSMCPAATGVPLVMDTEGGGPLAHAAARTIDALVEHCDALGVGPGLGTGEGSRAAVLRCVQQERVSVVLDADALTCLSHTPELFRDFHAPAVLTPHPGEFKRLCAGLGLKNDLGLAASREGACTQLAQRLGHVVVLKGHGTVVSDGLRTWTCKAGHPCLATGGTGDVLTGLIAGLIAQFVPGVDAMHMRAKAPRMPVDPARPLDLFDAARLGVLIHARAGEAWARARGASGGLAAMDLVELLPALIEERRSEPSERA